MTHKNMFLSFACIWFGDFISTIGTGLTAFCLGVYAFTLTGQATSTAMIVLCSYLPAFLFRPLGGILADRIDRSYLMIAGNIGSAVGIAMVYFIITNHHDNLLLIYTGVLFSS
ncbi:MAG TPA: MFS transporter, partial [Legionellaceae bacterium]|nr:MFS transporter [Legionellaceae bacterium]